MSFPIKSESFGGTNRGISGLSIIDTPNGVFYAVNRYQSTDCKAETEAL
ncbi:MAG TPA: hypothetical protein VGU44_02535 [Gammaproteobacteria bacterium]|nr:hypothetical protein [Gammaproteobacteria bacterium]